MEDGGDIGLAGVQGGVPQGGGDLHCLEHRGFHTTLGLANWGNSIFINIFKVKCLYLR